MPAPKKHPTHPTYPVSKPVDLNFTGTHPGIGERENVGFMADSLPRVERFRYISPIGATDTSPAHRAGCSRRLKTLCSEGAPHHRQVGRRSWVPLDVAHLQRAVLCTLPIDPARCTGLICGRPLGAFRRDEYIFHQFRDAPPHHYNAGLISSLTGCIRVVRIFFLSPSSTSGKGPTAL